MTSGNLGGIRKIKNGFTYVNVYGEETYFESTEKLFQYLLLMLENRSEYFGGNSYGHIHVFREPNETHTSPAEAELA